MFVWAPQAKGKARALASVSSCPRNQFSTHLPMYAIAMSLGGSHTARQTGTIWAMSLRAKTPPTSVELVWLPRNLDLPSSGGQPTATQAAWKPNQSRCLGGGHPSD